MHQNWRAEEARLLDVWVALRRTAARRPTPRNEAAAEAAFTAYRDHLLGRLQQQQVQHDDGAVAT